MSIKKISRINRNTAGHWVGDGFPVRTMFSYQTQGAEISPFLLLDHAGPAIFEPSDKPRGVEEHPHRGFETVTIVYQGEVEHSDNAGNAGKIGPGDVQWMTAASGILHEEMHGRDFTRKGGTLEMVQLWVNLPAEHKMSTPKYQEIVSNRIPVVTLNNGGGLARVIAGEYVADEGLVKGAAKTFTPVNLFDMRLKAGHSVDISLKDGFNTSLLVLKGAVKANAEEVISDKELVLLEQEGDHITLEAVGDDAIALVMSGEPIDEPIVGQGPFVMNTQEEIRRAISDYRAGLF